MPPPSFHGKILLASIAVIAIIAAYTGISDLLAGPGPGLAEIAVEHDTPLTLSLDVAEGKALMLVHASHSGTHTIHMSVPEDWVRTEVRGVALSDVKREGASLGFVRWSMPAGAEIQFHTKRFSTARFHNPSGVPLTVKLTVVDLQQRKTEREAFIVTDSPGTISLPSGR